MKRTVRILLGVVGGMAVLVVAAWVLIHTLGTNQMVYEGQTMDYWSGELTNRDAAASNRAAAVVSSQIIPYLTNEVASDTHDSGLRVVLVNQLNQLPGVQIDFLPAEQRRISAVMDLASFGTRAAVAKPILVDLQNGHPSKEMAKVLPRALRQLDGEVAKPRTAAAPKKSAAPKAATAAPAAEPAKQPAAAEPPK